jgi:hypothetical protein
MRRLLVAEGVVSLRKSGPPGSGFCADEWASTAQRLNHQFCGRHARERLLARVQVDRIGHAGTSGRAYQSGLDCCQRFFMICLPVGPSINPAETSQRPAVVTSLITRAPQVPQNARRLSGEDWYQTRAASPVIPIASRGAARKALKLPCIFWQSPQWQARTPAAVTGRVR